MVITKEFMNINSSRIYDTVAVYLLIAFCGRSCSYLELTSGHRFIAVVCSKVQVRPSMSHDITITRSLQKILPESH